MKGADWIRLVILYGFGMAAAAAMGMLGPLVGDLSSAMRVAVGVAGGALLCQLLPGSLFGSLIGALIDRAGARRILLAAGVLLIGVDVAQFFVSGLVWFCIDLLVQGLAVSAVLSSGQVMVTALAGGVDQIRNLTIWSTVTFVGYAAGLLIAATSAGSVHWRYAFLLHGALISLLPVVGLVLPRVRATVAKTDLLGVLKEVAVLRLGLALGFASIAGVGTNAGISIYLHRVQGVSLAFSASMAATGNLLSMAGSFVVAWLLSRGALPGSLAAGISLVAILCGMVLYHPAAALPLVIPMLFISQSCASAVTALTYTSLPGKLVDSSKIGAATGLVVQVSGIGGMLGPPLYFAVLAGNQWLPIAMTLVLLWGGAFLLMPFRRLPWAPRAEIA